MLVLSRNGRTPLRIPRKYVFYNSHQVIGGAELSCGGAREGKLVELLFIENGR